MCLQKTTKDAIAYLKGSPLEDGRPVVGLSLKDSPVIRPYLHDLHICYLADNGESYGYIQNRHLEEDGISLDELHQIGLRNLNTLIAQRKSKVERHGQVFAFLMGGDFEASALLLDELWEGDFKKFVTGDYASVVPARDVLAFCDVSSDRGIGELQAVIDRVWLTEDHLISNRIYVRRSSDWTAFES
jgi:uncharacterized protein YtpQ (UPF0354 family)